MWLFALFLAIPLIEIALFIQVGGLIGLWPTLAIVVLTAIAGTWLVRAQGGQALAQLRLSMAQLDDPAEPLAHGAMILLAGALLLTPGFFTDTVGFLLLVPRVRLGVLRWRGGRVRMQAFQMGPGPQAQHHRPDDRVIDAEFEEVEPGKRPTHRPSGWTQH